MIPIRQNHTATRKRPTVTRDSANAAKRDYATPADEITFACMFQTRGGALSQDEEGNTFSYDAILYVKDESIDIVPDDQISGIKLNGAVLETDIFRVTGREPKTCLSNGPFSHYELPLTRETVRT